MTSIDYNIALRDFFQSRFANDLVREDNFCSQITFCVKASALTEICRALRSETELDVRLLADITSVDWLDHLSESEGRFEIVYNFYSLKHKARFFLSVRLGAENPTIASLTSIWPGANWMEREVYDMMGIAFEGHPNLTKILTADDLEGHPLRRDFPLTWEVPRFSHNKDLPPEVIE